MRLGSIGQLAGALALTAGLAGCIDVTMDVEILSETNGKATTTMEMGADFYAMAKAGMGAEGQGAGMEGFCTEEGDVLTENADGSATCITIEEGSFADLKIGEGDDGSKVEVISPGVVRVSFSTADMQSEVGGEEQDEQTKAMMQAFFEGHNVTLRVRGREIIETNLPNRPDGGTAEIVIPFLDLLNGATDLPAELFATVRTN